MRRFNGEFEVGWVYEIKGVGLLYSVGGFFNEYVVCVLGGWERWELLWWRGKDFV